MEYEEYLHKCAMQAHTIRDTKERIGQFYVNMLPREYQVKLFSSETSNDPFYNDQRLPAFFKWLEEVMKNEI